MDRRLAASSMARRPGSLAEADLQGWLDKRKPGSSRLVTQRREPRPGRNFIGRVRGQDYWNPDQPDDPQPGHTLARLWRHHDKKFRSRHADYTYWTKYGIRDYRGGGRSSAGNGVPGRRGGIARLILGLGVKIRGAMIQMCESPTERNGAERVGKNPSGVLMGPPPRSGNHLTRSVRPARPSAR